jgi:hypothetical protein
MARQKKKKKAKTIAPLKKDTTRKKRTRATEPPASEQDLVGKIANERVQGNARTAQKARNPPKCAF